jgi:hypothetical protein
VDKVRLSIFDSRSSLLWAIVATVFAGTCAVEAYYVSKGIPISCKKDELLLARTHGRLILGDSRAETGLVPETLTHVLGAGEWANVALPGRSPINEILSLEWIGARPSLALVAVSPASIYGAFYVDPQVPKREFENNRDTLVRVYRWIRYPYRHSEKILSEWVKARFRFPYGFQGLAAVALYGAVSDRFDAFGWRDLRRLGDEAQFTRVWNRHFYQDECLKPNSFGRDEIDRVFAAALSGLRRGGDVAMVRLPCSPEIRAIENRFYPDFDTRMRLLAAAEGIRYFEEMAEVEIDWRGSDGSHLPNPEVATEVTEKVGRRLASGAGALSRRPR